MYRIESKVRKIIGICVIALLFTGCNNASDLYVKKQKEAAQTENAGEEVTGAETVQVPEKKDEAVQMPEKSDGEAENESESNPQTSGIVKEEPTVPQIYVQVSGAVVNPGVYQLEEGARIFQAVELAGGVTEQADINAINQAQVLSDGQMIYVYALGEQLNPTLPDGQQGQAQSGLEDGKVNLNTATAEDLQTLPGIGQSKADIIISYREEYGPFESIEGLMDIPGIKEGVFSKIKDHIKVN